MNESAGKEPVPLPVMRNSRRVKDKIIHDPFIAECRYGNKDSNKDDNDGDSNTHLPGS
jgi:hypothetical protein